MRRGREKPLERRTAHMKTAQPRTRTAAPVTATEAA
jgi:hypothetical protein